VSDGSGRSTGIAKTQTAWAGQSIDNDDYEAHLLSQRSILSISRQPSDSDSLTSCLVPPLTLHLFD